MRAWVALTLLLSVSCTFDYGVLKGTGVTNDGGADSGARDGADGMLDGPVGAKDVAPEAGNGHDGPVPVDALAGDAPVDVYGIVMEDAGPDGEPSTGGAGGTGSTETGGTGGSTSLDTGGTGAGGSEGGATSTGGVVGSGGEGGAGGFTGLGGTSASLSRTGGSGGFAGTRTGGAGGTATGGVGGTTPDAGVDSPVVDASVDMPADGAVDGGEGDAAGDALFCSPGQGACVGNAYCSCNTAGTGCMTSLQDCGSTLTCSPSLGGCVLVDTVPFNPNDTTGFSKNSISNVLKLNFYSVSAARRLLKIEQYIAPSSGAPLHWVIYRSTTKEGTYTLDQTYNSTATSSADGYQASPVIDYALSSSYYYAIGVSWESGTTAYWYHTAAATVPFALSASGGISMLSGVSPALTSTSPPTLPTSIIWTLSSTLYYPQRLTTK